jgi:hypothetical protein
MCHARHGQPMANRRWARPHLATAWRTTAFQRWPGEVRHADWIQLLGIPRSGVIDTPDGIYTPQLLHVADGPETVGRIAWAQRIAGSRQPAKHGTDRGVSFPLELFRLSVWVRRLIELMNSLSAGSENTWPLSDPAGGRVRVSSTRVYGDAQNSPDVAQPPASTPFSPRQIGTYGHRISCSRV